MSLPAAYIFKTVLKLKHKRLPPQSYGVLGKGTCVGFLNHAQKREKRDDGRLTIDHLHMNTDTPLMLHQLYIQSISTSLRNNGHYVVMMSSTK